MPPFVNKLNFGMVCYMNFGMVWYGMYKPKIQNCKNLFQDHSHLSKRAKIFAYEVHSITIFSFMTFSGEALGSCSPVFHSIPESAI